MGSAFSGDPDCNDSGEAIGWDNGLFTCLSISAAFDATAQDALTWSDGANASNLWTFDLSGTDPTLLFRTGGFTFTGVVSVSANFEVVGYASVSQYLGAGVTGAADCNDATAKLLYDSGTGLFSCGTLADRSE